MNQPSSSLVLYMGDEKKWDFLKKNEPNPFLISLLHGSQKNKKISKKKWTRWLSHSSSKWEKKKELEEENKSGDG